MAQRKTNEAKPLETEGTVKSLLAGSQLLQGQYLIDEVLAYDGFEISYSARDVLGRHLIVKEYFPYSLCVRDNSNTVSVIPGMQDQFSSALKLFTDEALSLNRISHPNVLGIQRVFEYNSTAYFATDCFEGDWASELVNYGSSKFDANEIVSIAEKLISAIAHVHKQGLLHLGITPQSILVRKDGEPFLGYFSQAKIEAAEAHSTLSGINRINEGYSAQEQYIRGGLRGPWSDIYGLAASLYFLIAGKVPISGNQRLLKMADDQLDPNIPLSGKFDSYPPGFLEAIDQAMQILPSDRFSSALEWRDRISLTNDIKAILLAGDGEPNPSEAESLEQTVFAPDSLTSQIHLGDGSLAKEETSKLGRARDEFLRYLGYEQLSEDSDV